MAKCSILGAVSFSGCILGNCYFHFIFYFFDIKLCIFSYFLFNVQESALLFPSHPPIPPIAISAFFID